MISVMRIRPPFLLAMAALGACAHGGAAIPAAEPRDPPSPALRVYDCDEGVALLVRGVPGDRTVEVEWGDRRVTLERVAAGSTAAYADEGFRFEPRGDEASFAADASTYACRHGERGATIERAAAEGAVVWAVGNEPGWVLALYPERFVFEGDYGETRYQGAIGEVVEDGGARRYVGHAGPHEVVIGVRPGLCHDGMSGAPFGAEVRVTREGDEYRGCGLLLGGPAGD